MNAALKVFMDYNRNKTHSKVNIMGGGWQVMWELQLNAYGNLKMTCVCFGEVPGDEVINSLYDSNFDSTLACKSSKGVQKE